MIYADIPSFGKAPLAMYVGLESADVAVFGVPWDGTGTQRGARFGPRGIRVQSQYFYELWNPADPPWISVDQRRARVRQGFKMVDCGDVRVWPGDTMRTSESIRKAARLVASHAFCLMLGGDHYVMYPTYQGVCDAHAGKRVGIVHVDAHNDLEDSDPVFGTHWSGTPIRRSIEHSKLDPRAVAQIGLRGFTKSTGIDYQVKNGITVIPMRELNEIGVQKAARRAMDAVRGHCDMVYLTVDIDSVDPSCAPGTGTPTPGGIMGGDFVNLFRALGTYPEIVALDLVELAPPLDPTDISSNLAAHAIFSFLEEHFLLPREDK